MKIHVPHWAAYDPQHEIQLIRPSAEQVVKMMLSILQLPLESETDAIVRLTKLGWIVRSVDLVVDDGVPDGGVQRF